LTLNYTLLAIEDLILFIYDFIVSAFLLYEIENGFKISFVCLDKKFIINFKA